MTIEYRDERTITPTPLGHALIHIAGGIGKLAAMAAFIAVAIWGYQHPARNLTALVWLAVFALALWFLWALTSTPATDQDDYSAHNEQANVARSKRRA